MTASHIWALKVLIFFLWRTHPAILYLPVVALNSMKFTLAKWYKKQNENNKQVEHYSYSKPAVLSDPDLQSTPLPNLPTLEGTIEIALSLIKNTETYNETELESIAVMYIKLVDIYKEKSGTVNADDFIKDGKFVVQEGSLPTISPQELQNAITNMLKYGGRLPKDIQHLLGYLQSGYKTQYGAGLFFGTKPEYPQNVVTNIVNNAYDIFRTRPSIQYAVITTRLIGPEAYIELEKLGEMNIKSLLKCLLLDCHLDYIQSNRSKLEISSIGGFNFVKPLTNQVRNGCKYNGPFEFSLTTLHGRIAKVLNNDIPDRFRILLNCLDLALSATKEGGSKKLKYKKTEERIVVKGRQRVVYRGPRGGRYIMSDGAFQRAAR